MKQFSIILLLFVLLASTAARPAYAGKKIAYLTDVEGKWQKFRDFLQGNPYVFRDAQGVIQLKDGVTFVYGGDVTDTGPNNIRVANALNDLKARYGDRVVLIAGNRDIGKLKLESFLHDPLPKKLAEEMTKRGLPDTSVSRLKIFYDFVGYPGAYEDRRRELESVRGRSVSEQELADELVADLQAGGRARNYLTSAQLAYRDGETLFVHGAVLDENFGKVPDRPGQLYSNPDEWTRELNRWYADRIANWIKTGDAADLIAYQGAIPGTFKNLESVVYGRYTDSQGVSRMPSAALRAKLKAQGIFRIVVGHTPQGDGPSILRDDGFEIILADNTGAPHGSKILIDGAHVDLESSISLNGQTETYQMSWNLADDTPLGQRLLSNDYLVTARLSGGRWLTYFQGPPPDFRVEHQIVTDAELKRIGYASSTFNALSAQCAAAF